MQQPIRLLLPWLERDEAIRFLLGRVPLQNEDVAQYVEIWQHSRDALAQRPGFQEQIVDAPVPAELNDRITALQNRADIQQIRAELNCDIGIVDLENIISFQKFVAREEAEARVTNADPNDLGSLFDICLPQRSQQELPILFDEPNKAFTVSSLNPNLRIAGIDFDNGMFRFQIQVANSLVQVAEYRNRWFLRDGYHRCYGLLRRGITRIPCLIIRARNFQDVGATGANFLSYEVLFGEKPPTLRDFLDDNFSQNAERRATRKVLRISGQEFVVDI